MCKTHCDAPCPSSCSSSLTPALLLKAHLGGGGGRPQIQEIPSSRIVLEEILLFSSSWAYPCLLCPCFRGGGAPHRASKEPLAPRGAPAQALHFQFFLKKKTKKPSTRRHCNFFSGRVPKLTNHKAAYKTIQQLEGSSGRGRCHAGGGPCLSAAWGRARGHRGRCSPSSLWGWRTGGGCKTASTSPLCFQVAAVAGVYEVLDRLGFPELEGPEDEEPLRRLRGRWRAQSRGDVV